MSYPPPQPPLPPGMGPPMMPPGYGYGVPPMGMMPMMGMMPPMMRTTAPSSTSTATSSATIAKPSKKLVPQEIPKDTEEKPPVTTVFVGNISERAPDAMIRQMLQRCGNVLSWKRVQGASGKLQAFGFCEYEYPEATLCCIRLLNDWKIVDKNLLVKVDAKTKTLLEEYKKKKAAKKQKESTTKKAEGNGEEAEESSSQNGDEDGLDEFTLREDRVAKAGLDAIMREYADELAKEPIPDVTADDKKDKRKEKLVTNKVADPKEGIEELDLEEDEKDLINREINKFRDAHKDEDEKEVERNRERERRRREEEKERERRERERERERREREREQERREWEARERERSEREREREKYRSKTRSRSRSREPSYSSNRDRDRPDRNNEKDRDYEDEEEMYERKRMERKMREKESAYQEKLKAWEARERKKCREYDKEHDKEEDRKTEEAREARRLREFLEDYDDVRDDPKYYKGSALKKRLSEREKEMEADARDRQREKEEIEEIRRRLLDQGHPDVEIEMARIEREREEHLIPRLNKTPPRMTPEPEPPIKPANMKPLATVPVMPPPPASVSSQGSGSDDDNDADMGDYDSYNPSQTQSEDENSHSMSFIGPATRDDQNRAKMGFSGLKIGAAGSAAGSPDSSAGGKRKKLTVGDVFNQDDEQTELAKKRRLVPLDFSEDSNGSSKPSLGSAKPTTAEEKRKCIKNLIDRIPTAKAELFAYELDWSMVDTTLMDRRIKPWVNKKIVEYIGEEEPTLTDFICQKVMAHSHPQNILNDVSMVLDEEAEVFVVKMWRLLIYEIEAKKAGLVK